MTVARIINDKGRDVVTVAADVSLAEIAATLAEKRIGAVVVDGEGRHQRHHLGARHRARASPSTAARRSRMPAAEWMTAKVVTCRPEDTIHDVMQKMTTGRFRHLPVVEHGKLAGIVSIGDVVKRRIEEVEREADQIREYIATA